MGPINRPEMRLVNVMLAELQARRRPSFRCLWESNGQLSGEEATGAAAFMLNGERGKTRVSSLSTVQPPWKLFLTVDIHLTCVLFCNKHISGPSVTFPVLFWNHSLHKSAAVLLPAFFFFFPSPLCHLLLMSSFNLRYFSFVTFLPFWIDTPASRLLLFVGLLSTIFVSLSLKEEKAPIPGCHHSCLLKKKTSNFQKIQRIDDWHF